MKHLAAPPLSYSDQLPGDGSFEREQELIIDYVLTVEPSYCNSGSVFSSAALAL